MKIKLILSVKNNNINNDIGKNLKTIWLNYGEISVVLKKYIENEYLEKHETLNEIFLDGISFKSNIKI